MRIPVTFVLVLLIFPACKDSNPIDLTPVQLKCNNLENPSGTGKYPVFSWIIPGQARSTGQTAFQIILDTSPGNLKTDHECLWNSGKIESPENLWINYSGSDLEPATMYFWKVRIWNNEQNPTGWSKPASLLTGLFEDSDWNGAKWIGYEEIPDSLLLVPGVHGNGNNLGEVAKKRTVIPCFRKDFLVGKKVSHAYLFVSGLGQYEAYINGTKVGDRFLSPGWTSYRKTCYYNTYDVTKYLKRGQNTIGTIVGNGFYNINRERYRKLVIAFGAPKMILRLSVHYTDGSSESVISDESWKTFQSPVTFSSIYGGEDYDARLEQTGWCTPDFNDSGWDQTLAAKKPEGLLQPENDHPLKVMQTLLPQSVSLINDTICLYDFGQNASGIVRLTVRGKAGKEVRLLPGELIDDDSLITQRASGSPYYFSYILRGDKEEIWMPRFTYYGFRYVQVTGAIPAGNPNAHDFPVISNLEFLHTRNSAPVTGSFSCSDDLFNSIYELINWAIKSNLASVATDCPHREKLGWLEQTHLMGNSIKYIYDIRNLYDKIIDDMIDSQLENGLVPDIAPEYVPFEGGFRDSPEWGSACIIVPWDMFEWYGDIDAVRKAYPMMKKYLAYLESTSDNYIISHGLGDWYDLGPKFPGEAQLTPKAVTATSIFFYDARLLADMARLIGETGDAGQFLQLAENIRSSFNKAFFDPVKRVYSTGSQTAYAMPLFFGIPDDSLRKEVVLNLTRSIIENNKALTAGDIGYRYLLRVLEQEGFSNLIFEMNSRTDVPGYGYQLSKGATALTESWAGLRDVSNNHMMLGHLIEWFYSGIGGIRQIAGSKAYEHILICPEIFGDIKWAETSYMSAKGKIATSWRIEDGNLTLKVVIPGNCKATIEIPCPDPGKISVNGSPLKSAEIVDLIESKGGKTICNVLSGEYLFECSIY